MECDRCGAQVGRDAARCEYCGSERAVVGRTPQFGELPVQDGRSGGGTESMEERIREEEAFRLRFRAELERTVAEEVTRAGTARRADPGRAASGLSAGSPLPSASPAARALAAGRRATATATVFVLGIILIGLLIKLMQRMAG